MTIVRLQNAGKQYGGEGEVWRHPGLRFTLLRQDREEESATTVHQAALEPFAELVAMEERINREVQELEQRIEQLEARIVEIEAALGDPALYAAGADPTRPAPLAAEPDQLTAAPAKSYAAWERWARSLRACRLSQGYALDRSFSRSNGVLKYEISLYWSDIDQVAIAEVPELPGCKTHGDTYEEALAMVQEAMQAWIDVASEVGIPIPEPKGLRLMYA